MNKKLLFLGLAFFCLPWQGKSQNQQLADTLRAKGELFQEKGNFKQAEFYYQEALNFYKQLQDTASWLKTGLYYAEVLSYRAKYEESQRLLQELGNTNHPTVTLSYRARVQSDWGWIKGRQGQTEEAKKYYKTGLGLAKQARDTLLIGVLLNNLAHYSSGNEALAYYKETLPYFKTADNKRSLAIALRNIGNVYEDLHLYDRALSYFSQSLDIRQDLGNDNLMASIHQTLGNLQKKRGNYRQALIALQKSLEYRKMAGDPNATTSTLNAIGTLYSMLGDSKKALAYYRESLDLSKDFSSPLGLATKYKNIGNRLWALGNKDEATKYYRWALQKKRAAGEKQLLISSLLDISKVELDKNNYKEAHQYADEALAIADSLKSYEKLTAVNLVIGSIYDAQGQLKKGLTYHKRAYSYSAFLPENQRLTSLINLARAYQEVDSDSSLIYGRKAFHIIEKERSLAGAVSELRSNYLKQYSDFYIDLASWTLTYEGNVKEAYKLVEAAKARTLAEELSEASELVDEKLPEDVRIKKNKMLTNIDRLYSKINDQKNEAARAQTDQDIRAAELKYAAFQNSLYNRYPNYKKLTAASPVSLSTAQAINDEDTAIIEYAVTQNQVLAFLIYNQGVSVHQVPLSSPSDSTRSNSQLTKLVQNFKDAILSLASRQELQFHSDKLYHILLKPFEKQLPAFSNLIIVPDGALAYLPFEALRRNNSYLIEQFDIKYEPSVTSYTLLKKPVHNQKKQMLAVAGSGESSNAISAGSRSQSFLALPSTIIEIDSVSSHFSPSSTLKKENITEQALKKTLTEPYRFVHLATHGVIDEDDPNQSGLVLATQGNLEATSQEDGLLKSSEIYRMNLNSDMVVLSACNTGLGKYVKGEGMLGLQRSFFYAGTSSVVVSLWSVYDRSTAYLMNEFYKNIIASGSQEPSLYQSFMRWTGWDQTIPYGEKAEAMRQAKLTLIKHPLFNHPVYWAPFIVVGR